MIHIQGVKNASLFKVTQGERPSIWGLTDSSKVALNIDVMYLRQQQFLIDRLHGFSFTNVVCLMSKVNTAVLVSK